MPFLKSGMRRKEPLWRVNDRAAQKEGLRYVTLKKTLF